ncbi:hypothetical protein AAG570_013495 [Ranatra chinensis]|uniref:Uncharacterized protein n=1 Tax=Ranatra chinensis TaxID=642074 RepID=A0ABD0YCL3_9HEMI
MCGGRVRVWWGMKRGVVGARPVVRLLEPVLSSINLPPWGQHSRRPTRREVFLQVCRPCVFVVCLCSPTGVTLLCPICNYHGAVATANLSVPTFEKKVVSPSRELEANIYMRSVVSCSEFVGLNRFQLIAIRGARGTSAVGGGMTVRAKLVPAGTSTSPSHFAAVGYIRLPNAIFNTLAM